MSGKGARKSNGFSSICVFVVCNCVNHSNDNEICWWLGTATSCVSNYPGVHCREDARGMVVMKIDELVNSVRAMNSSTDAYKYPNEIRVVYNSFTIVNIPYDAKNMFDCLFVNQGLEVPTYIKAQLTGIINKFLRTPIKDRFPEKKYRLRWLNDMDGDPNYADYSHGTWFWKTHKVNAKTYTEKELQQLKINNPRFAPAIDVLKEPVEDD